MCFICDKKGNRIIRYCGGSKVLKEGANNLNYPHERYKKKTNRPLGKKELINKLVMDGVIRG